MLNYTQTPDPNTIVPFIPTQEHIAEPPFPAGAAGTMTFRKAVIEAESIEELTNGIICGQACYVDLIDGEVIASRYLADTIAEAMNSDEPEAFNVGFIIGLVDALLCARKTYPRGW